ncbi:YdcH family protein [Azovibrio restrictus]|uniref:YdcH family protein n=1 Tax=Azovibrio restrictus TaxID=146938 RepID=UPI0026EB5A09|nr:YdcH family protein [Azovibrio restrictus]MDD3481379.1 YdcH family protein [Azovibrio restrictus]
MQVEHHDLHHEFPEMRETILELKGSNAHFARLFDAYHSATNRVEALEGLDVPVDDFAIEAMKKERVRLKDELYQMLVAAQAA